MQRSRPTRSPKMESSHADVAGLPPGLRQLVSYLGDKLAFALVEQFGGQELAIPKKASADHRIAQALGLHSMMALVESFGNETITVHKRDSLARQIKHRRVAKLLASGKTQNQVAAQTGYTARHVRNVAATARAAEVDMQPDLFFGAETEETQPRIASWGAHNPFGAQP